MIVLSLVFKINFFENMIVNVIAFDVKIKQNQNSDIEKLHYGAYISAGWNTWNVYAYYGFNPIFKTASIDGEKVKMNFFGDVLHIPIVRVLLQTKKVSQILLKNINNEILYIVSDILSCSLF